MTARDLAAALASRLPQHSVRDGVWVEALDGFDDRDCGRCPRCGRALPRASVGPAVLSFGMSGPIGIPYTPQELAAACLVDGRRSRDAQKFSLDDLVDAARDIAAAFRAKGWKHWAKTMDRALSAPDPHERAETVGQTLELIRHAGPPALQNERELETLIASLAGYWPSKPRASDQ
jgi:hypothetical protein